MTIKTDTIAEYTAATGVTIDGVLIKDGLVDGIDVAAPFAGILATGATTGATSQAQAFTLGVTAGTVRLQGSATDNFLVNSTVNTIESGTNTNLISGGGQSGAPNRIGYVGKPVGTDYDPGPWAVDSGYVAGASNVSLIAGGYDHIVNQLNSLIVGGGHNFIMYHVTGHSVIVGGAYNCVSGGYGFIGGGYNNSVSAATGGAVLAGNNNHVSGGAGFIGVGYNNTVSSVSGIIIGGHDNTVTTGEAAAAISGAYNGATGAYAVIVGGYSNANAGDYAFVGGGYDCHIEAANNAVIAGGSGNTVSAGATYAVIAGGVSNTASGMISTVAGGFNNTAAGAFSFAAGRRAKANATGVFALADSTDADFTVSDPNVFGARFAGGYYLTGGNVGIGTTAPAALLHADQSSSTGAVPVLTVDQADVSEEFIRFIGTSTTDATQSLVDVADMTTPGALKGWLKIYVQDDQATNPIVDGAYYLPFYAAPTA